MYQFGKTLGGMTRTTGQSRHNMKNNAAESVRAKGVELLKRIGIRPRQTVLDFGCGNGNFTILVAEIVGHKGIVYALDKNSEKLDELKERLQKYGLHNVKTVKMSENVAIDLGRNSVDAVLLYDIIHLVGENDTSKIMDRKALYNEIYRVVKKNGLISVYPTHLKTHTDVSDASEIENEILDGGFELKEMFTTTTIHDGVWEAGTILNFIK